MGRAWHDAVASELPAAQASRWRTEHAIQWARLFALALTAGVTISLRGLSPDPRWLITLLLALTVAGVAVGLRTARGPRQLELLGVGAFTGDAVTVTLALWVVNTNPADPIWAITGLLGIEAAARWGVRGAVIGGVASAALAGWWATMAYAAEGRDLSVESLVFRGVVLLVLALPAGRLVDHLRQEQQRARQLYEASTELILILDGRGRVAGANPAAGALLDRPPERLRGAAVQELLPGLPPVSHLLAITGGDEPAPVLVTVAGSQPRTLAVTAQRSGEQAMVHVIGRDVTAQRSREEQLRYQALHDVLTGLPNRTALQERIDAELAGGGIFGLLFIDLDGFKAVNDVYGHAIGDRVLQRIADRLRNTVRGSDEPYRLAGDEFCVVVTPADLDSLDRVALRVAAALDSTVEVAGRRIATGASVGGSLATPGDDRDRLLARADAAMYAQKAARGERPARVAEDLGGVG